LNVACADVDVVCPGIKLAVCCCETLPLIEMLMDTICWLTAFRTKITAEPTVADTE
jgi:hypothetical protein